MLAPVSLGLFAVVFLIVVVTSLDGGSGSVGKSPAPSARSSSHGSASTSSSPAGRRSTNPRVYVIKPGDTLSKISAATGVPVEQLQALNPLIDPKGLVTGQRIKLRE